MSLFINAFLNLSVVTSGRIAELFLRRYFVCFCFGKILLMGHKGFVDCDSWSFPSAFSKSSQLSILIEVYFLLKHLSRKCCIVVRSESVAPYTDRPKVKFGNTTELKRRSSSSCCKPSFLSDLKIKRHLFAFISLDQTCTLYLQFSWNVTPNIGRQNSFRKRPRRILAYLFLLAERFLEWLICLET